MSLRPHSDWCRDPDYCFDVILFAGVHAHAAQQSWAQRLERVQMQAVDRAVNIVNGVIGASVRGTGGVHGAAASLEELMHSELSAHERVRAAQGIAEADDMDVHPQKVVQVASKVSVHRMVQVCDASSIPWPISGSSHMHSAVTSTWDYSCLLDPTACNCIAVDFR
jgi:hypothetical protein